MALVPAWPLQFQKDLGISWFHIGGAFCIVQGEGDQMLLVTEQLSSDLVVFDLATGEKLHEVMFVHLHLDMRVDIKPTFCASPASAGTVVLTHDTKVNEVWVRHARHGTDPTVRMMYDSPDPVWALDANEQVVAIFDCRPHVTIIDWADCSVKFVLGLERHGTWHYRYSSSIIKLLRDGRHFLVKFPSKRRISKFTFDGTVVWEKSLSDSGCVTEAADGTLFIVDWASTKRSYIMKTTPDGDEIGQHDYTNTNASCMETCRDGRLVVGVFNAKTQFGFHVFSRCLNLRLTWVRAAVTRALEIIK